MIAKQNSLLEIGSERLRPDRVVTYLQMAQIIARRSTCKRAQVGCLVTDEKGLILASGYNGNPPGMAHCIDEDCLMENGHCISTLHAEMNAMARFIAAGYFRCYCTHAPCLACLKVGVTKGIMTWTYLTHYEDESRDKFIRWYNEQKRTGEVIISLQHVMLKDNDNYTLVG
jgi:dCMP deaminase